MEFFRNIISEIKYAFGFGEPLPATIDTISKLERISKDHDRKMATYRRSLLLQKEPLEPFEVKELKRWLWALEKDIEIFGPTREDENLITEIKNRICAEMVAHGTVV